MVHPKSVLAVLACLTLMACDVGPTGHGTAPPGVSQTEWDAEVQARRDARRKTYMGPRGGATGR
ncbi:hypothetical protein ACFORG_21210 [Lutimaribacter marinistellae]|uniref:Lipoprotein n=1 Tax=Lutimaribacter marinistellae TaxID=1820329 RepID=A0ABV7TP02_9RHOB